MKVSVLLLLLNICSIYFMYAFPYKREYIDEELMIKVPQSELYVRMRGNLQGPLIVGLHGGPGGYSGIDIKLMGPGLEDNFLVAYLDQRGCGKSSECKDKTMLTINQYIRDLDIVIDSLRKRYHKKKLNLIGTSWGGMYGFLYLLENQEKVYTFACIDGKVNSHYQNHSLIDYELKLISELLTDGISKEKSNELLVMQKELTRIRNSNFEEYYADVNLIKHEFPPRLGFNAYFSDTSKIISLNDVLQDKDLLALMKYSKKEYLKVGEKAEIVNEAFRNTPSYNNLNIEFELYRITVPVAVIQGEKDFVVGTEHARLIYDALTSLSNDMKEIHLIPYTGHCPAIESPEILLEILNNFLKKNNEI